MIRIATYHRIWQFAALCCLTPPTSLAGDWMTWASSYTHDSRGHRVDQYALPAEPLGPSRSDVVRSGFRHFRSTLQAGQSADNYHVTEQWGQPVVPYEHWRFPFRPYGTPYDAWGPPTPYGMFFGGGPFLPWAGVPGMPPAGHWPGGPGTGGPGSGGPGMGGSWPGGGWPGGGWPGAGPGMGGPWMGHQPWMGGGQFGFPLQPPYLNQPWFDGTYPDAPPLPLMTQPDRQFFWKPGR